MKDSILSQISLLNEEEKSRLYLIIERFLNDNEVAFVLAPNKEDLQETDFIADAMLTKTILDGETAASKVPVTLEKGEYVYFCPLNNTPKYKLIVE